MRWKPWYTSAGTHLMLAILVFLLILYCAIFGANSLPR